VRGNIGLWRARLDTRNFTFEGYGVDKGTARAVLVAGLERHAQEYRIPAVWWSEYREDIYLTYISAGVAYRDGEALPPVEYKK
jgi:hypothetical protein